MPAQVPIILVAVEVIDDGAGDGRDDDHDGRPRGQGRQNDGEGNDVDDGADDVKGGRENADGAHARFAVGIFEFFIESGIVKGRLVHRFGFGDDFHFNMIGNKFAGERGNHALDLGNDALAKQVNELPNEQPKDGFEGLKSARCRIRADQGGDFVDQISADIGADNRQNAVGDAKGHHPEEKQRRRFPNQRDDIKKARRKSLDFLLQIRRHFP